MRELNAQKSNPKKPDVARNARAISRLFFQLKRGATTKDVEKGFPLSLLTENFAKKDKTRKLGKVFFEKATPESLILPLFPDGAIIKYADDLQKTLGENVKVIFVTQDILADLLSLSCGVQSEEYQSGKAIDDVDLLYSGVYELPKNFWSTATIISEGVAEKLKFWNIKTDISEKWFLNQFLFIPTDDSSDEVKEYIVRDIGADGIVKISEINNYYLGHLSVWGKHALDRLQNFYINALMDPTIHFVSGAGIMGTGKTMLAVAAALEQTAEAVKTYRGILLTKEATAIGEEIGFFPGTEEKKMAPWMRAFTDNLDFLTKGNTASVLRYIEVTSIATTQGRTIHGKFVIIDETQNLTPEQMKALIGRSGLGTKYVCLGNVRQILKPYVTPETCGLTHVVENFKQWKYSAHVTLEKCARSILAEFAADHL